MAEQEIEFTTVVETGFQVKLNEHAIFRINI